MKLNRLASTTKSHARESVERALYVTTSGTRRVEALESIEGDRERSTQQEIAEFEQQAIGPFNGDGRIHEDAREVVAQLLHLGSGVDGLIRMQQVSPDLHTVDDLA